MTEACAADACHTPRLWRPGVLLALALALVTGVGPVAALAGERRPGRGAGAASAAQVRVSRQAMTGPKRVTLGIGLLFTTQFDGSRYANGNCNMAAGAMLFEVQTGRRVSGATMRRWSGARTRGTSLLDLRRAFRRQGQRLRIREDLPFGTFVRQIRKGRSAVVQGWYGNLPRALVLQPGYTGAHSLFVLGYSRHALRGRGAFYVMDPLGSGGYRGAWWSRAAMRHFGWRGTPSTVGAGRRAFYGNVALQVMGRDGKVTRRTHRPTFQSYWATSKSLVLRAHRVRIPSRSLSGGRPAILRVHDPRLRLTLQRVRTRGLSSPLRSWARAVRSYRLQDRKIVVRSRPGARVTAAASGRVIYRAWSLRHGQSIWVKHGPRLTTIYRGLARVDVKPGQWVRQGQVIGRLPRREGRRRSSELRFVVAVGRDPRGSATRVNPVRYLRETRKDRD